VTVLATLAYTIVIVGYVIHRGIIGIVIVYSVEYSLRYK
jgi:hypothetical protein